MRQLLIDIVVSIVFALLIYYGLTFAGMTDTRWAAAIAAGSAIAIVAIGKRIIRPKTP